MKRLLAIGVVSLLIGSPRFGQDPAAIADASRDRFVGSVAAGLARAAGCRRERSQDRLLRVVCFHSRRPRVGPGDGARTARHRLLPGLSNIRKAATRPPTAAYEVNERDHTFTFHVEGALVRSLIGKDLPRAYEFSGKQLIVKSTRPDEHWRVAGNITKRDRSSHSTVWKDGNHAETQTWKRQSGSLGPRVRAAWE